MSQFTFTLTRFSEEVVAFYRVLHGDQLARSGEEMIAWKLRDHPAGPGEVLLARDAKTEAPCGLLAFVPARLRQPDGSILLGAQAIDTIVAPEARGKWLFVLMGRAYYEQTSSAFVYGFPNKAAAPGWFKRLNWTRYGSVPFHMRPLRTGLLAKRVGWWVPNLPLPVFGTTSGSEMPIDRFTSAHEAAWHRMLAKTPGCAAIERDKDYLNWRYVERPEGDYERWADAEGNFIVTRLREAHGAFILYLMEAVGDPGRLAPMVRRAFVRAREKGADVVLAWGFPRGPSGELLKRVQAFLLPERWRPIELHFGAHSLSDAFRPRTEDDWFLSYADSDTV